MALLGRAALTTTSRTTTTTLLRLRPLLATTTPFSLQQRRHKSGPYGYTQAKALVFSRYGEPRDVLSLHTHSISPSLPSGSALIRALACPVNPADVNTIQGTYGAKPPFDTLALGTSKPSAVPGNEGVFEVVTLGSPSSDTTPLQKGDWVLPAKSSFGTFRTHALVPDATSNLYKIDKTGLTPAQAATVSVNPASAYCMLRRYVDFFDIASGGGGGGNGGGWFIQNGANSGVGRAAIQLARIWGIKSINVIRDRDTPEATSALKKELQALGATIVVTETEFLDRSFSTLLKETLRGGESVKLALNCVGGKSAAGLVRTLGEKGCMVTYGGMSRQTFTFPTGQAIFRRLRLEGFWLSAIAKEEPGFKRQVVEEILGYMREGKFQMAPVDEVRWEWETSEEMLKEAVQGTLEGFRSGKGLFVFGET